MFDPLPTARRIASRRRLPTPIRLRPALAVLGALCPLLLSAPPASAQAQPDAPAGQRASSRAAIEARLTTQMQRLVDAQRRIEGQGQHVTVSARLNPRGDLLVLNLSVEYVPRHYGAELEDLLDELSTAAYDLLRDGSGVKEVQFRFGGKTLFDHFPAERERERAPSGAVPTLAGSVVVAAGHGVYKHFGFKDWRAQRDPSNGITEDFITPGYASELSTWLTARSTATVSLARSTATSLHVPSNYPWWQMAARYHLKDLYPQNPEIWNARPNDTSNLRDRNEDLESRPRFANHLGAATLIHLHTNAAGATATGARAIVQSGRAADKTLADNMLCYMEELIQAKAGYESYRVPKSADISDKAENRLAAMPSVIVEVGFHTNASDATALQDPVFRTAAMKGVEKGYRLTGEGEPCQHLKLGTVPAATGLQGVPIPVKLPYKGYPQFAVQAVIEIVTCPSGWSCNGGVATYPDKLPSPLGYTFTCTVSSPLPPATFRLRTTLKDLDEVESKPVEHDVTCTPAAGQAANGQSPGGKGQFTVGPM